MQPMKMKSGSFRSWDEIHSSWGSRGTWPALSVSVGKEHCFGACSMRPTAACGKDLRVIQPDFG